MKRSYKAAVLGVAAAMCLLCGCGAKDMTGAPYSEIEAYMAANPDKAVTYTVFGNLSTSEIKRRPGLSYLVSRRSLLSFLPSFQSLRFTLLDLRFGMVALLVVLRPMVFHTEQYHIVRIIAQPFGFINRLGRLEGNQVVMVDALANPSRPRQPLVACLPTVLLAVADAPLAKPFGSGIYYRLGLGPSLRVQHAPVLGAIP